MVRMNKILTVFRVISILIIVLLFLSIGFGWNFDTKIFELTHGKMLTLKQLLWYLLLLFLLVYVVLTMANTIRTHLKAGQKGRTSEKGFSLLEILIALMIFAVGIVSVVALLGAATSTHARGVDAYHVSHLASTVLAELERTGPQTVFNQQHPAFPPNYTYDVETEEIPQTNGLMLVKVRVKWQRGGRKNSEEFVTTMLRQR